MIRKPLKELGSAWDNARWHLYETMGLGKGGHGSLVTPSSMEDSMMLLEEGWALLYDSRLVLSKDRVGSPPSTAPFVEFGTEEDAVEFILRWA